ncbi:MAG: hypothetical protein WA197_20410 [Candidatus Acidiferrales bacterium]
MSGLAAFENDVRGAPLAGRSFPDPSNASEHPFVNYAESGPNASARAVVDYLLRETDLSQLMDRGSLLVSVGTGDWISWSFQLHPAAIDPAGTISKLWNRFGKRSFRRCWPRAAKSAWFRSTGAPSLHCEVVPSTFRDRNGTFVQGHVDAANPWNHLQKHLIEDYLPSLGIGKHPGPREILQSLPPARR